MPVTVLAIADQVSPSLYEYFCPERWTRVDLILSCGDLPPDYLDFLCSSLDVPLLYVRGNHDTTYQSSQYDGCENIHGKIVSRAGLHIAGFQGCRRYNDGPYQYSEAQMRATVRRARLTSIRTGPADIVVTHAPPAGIHDGNDVCHRGFDSFNTLMDAWHPRFFIHGHTHAYEGRERVTLVGSTTVVNAYPYYLFQMETAGETQERPREEPVLPQANASKSGPGRL